MSKAFYNDLKIGILGGGQLGRMFIQEAVNYNANISVLDPDADAPCRYLTPDFVQGDFKDFNTVYHFGKTKDVITIEIEHVNIEALEKLEKEGKTIYPQPAILKIIQDKGLQKNFYKENKIPTADFYLIENKSEIKNYSSQFPFMQKLRKGGYDGKGVTKLSNAANTDKAFDAPSVLEKLIDFEKEISVIVARNASGELKSFPVVELEFNPEANLVEFLFSPANISTDINNKAIKIAEDVANKLKIVGVLAVEMFVTKNGEVLVNEIAPRPHNSGHHTIEANITSQYEQHLRAILNLPLGSTDTIYTAVMVNLLGEKEFEGEAKYQNMQELMKMDGLYIHLYGKKKTKPFRKMGHATIVGKDLNEVRKKALIVKEQLKVIA